jgi:Holliday junction DNA helicase RuvA
MIAGLRGRIHAKHADALLVEVGGVIYRVGTSANSVAEAGVVGDEIELETYLVVREDVLALYGFADGDELRIFETLIGVTGVGPRLACAVLSVLRPSALLSAVEQGNTELLATVPGVGKKTAARLIVELRGKLPDAAVGGTVAAGSDDADVVAALRALGYSLGEANMAVAQMERREGLSVEERIVKALQSLAEA